jgi:hypothetical protein
MSHSFLTRPTSCIVSSPCHFLIFSVRTLPFRFAERRAIAAEPRAVHAPDRPHHQRLHVALECSFHELEGDDRVIVRERKLSQDTHAVCVRLDAVLT